MLYIELNTVLYIELNTVLYIELNTVLYIYRNSRERIITYFNLLLSGYDGSSFFLELSQHFLNQA